MLYFGVKERKKLVVVCALLEHEIIMTIPAVAELVVEFQVVYKFLNTPRQDPVHSWKAGPGEVMTVENLVLKSYLAIQILFCPIGV